jgi:hypothetical protein
MEECLRFYDQFTKPEAKTPNEDFALLGCNDRFFLLTSILRRPDVKKNWLFNRVREVEADLDGHIDLWARYHYKSTIVTFAGAIQEVLRDPEITIAIFSVTQRIALKFLNQIKIEFESNDALKLIYSDVLYANPKRQGAVWGVQEGIVVKRKGNPKESTIEAHGLIDGQPTSRHYRLHIYDDVVTQDYLSDELIQKTTERWEMADNLGTSEGVRKWVVGTRYHFADTYGEMIKRGSLIPRIHAATHNGKLDGVPVFLGMEHWTKIKRDQRSTVSAQMLLNPIAGTDATFQSTWLKTYEVVPAIMNVYIMCDPSKGTGARSDRSAIAVIGVDPAGNKYFLDGVRHRMKLSERYRYLCMFRHKWMRHEGVQNVEIGYERYGMQTDLETIKEYMERDGEYYLIQELNTPKQGPHSKNDRIERMEPDIKNGIFYLPLVVFHADYRERSQGNAIWFPWTDEDERKADRNSIEGSYVVGQIVYRPLMGMTRLQRSVSLRRVVAPIKRIDESNHVYDVTRSLIDEILQHPFGQYKDLIDATSRIYDMEPKRPIQYEVSSMHQVDDDFQPESGGGGPEDNYQGTVFDEAIESDESKMGWQ